METKKWIWCNGMENELLRNTGLLLFRVVVGTFMLLHGWQKIIDFETLRNIFPDPLGIGTSSSLFLIIFAEFGCSVLIILGLFTRLAAIPLIIGMSVAAFVIHANDSFAIKELPLLYLASYVLIAFLGSGKFSLDFFLNRICNKYYRKSPDSIHKE